MYRTLTIDASALLAAVVARDEGLLGTYLDLAEGALLRIYDPEIVGRSNDVNEAKIDAEPDRYAKVPQYSREYRLMAEFIDQVDDDLARLLDAALAGREAFRKFEAVLSGWPDEQRQWETFREEALTRWVLSWLRSLGIEPHWDRPLLPDDPSEVPWLLRVALRDGQDNPRLIRCASVEEARHTFVQIVRELCELRREPVRMRTLRNETRFSRGGVEVRRDGTVVTLRMSHG